MKKLLLLLMLFCTTAFADEWECITTMGFRNDVRMKTPDGWIVRTYTGGITYVPDKDHKWVLKK